MSDLENRENTDEEVRQAANARRQAFIAKRMGGGNSSNLMNSMRLTMALSSGRFDLAKQLYDDGMDINGDYLGSSTALHWASSEGYIEAVLFLTKAGANVNATNKKGKTALHLASEKGYFQIVGVLVDAGANVDATDGYGNTPLHCASSNGHLEVAELLIKAGAKTSNMPENGFVALQKALYARWFDVAELLIDAGASCKIIVSGKKLSVRHLPNNSDTDDGSTSEPEEEFSVGDLLSSTHDRASTTFISKTYKIFTDAGATVDGATATISPLVPSDVIRAIVPENTPFWLAANNDAPMLAVELAGGLDPNMKTENGMTLLHWACAGDAPECVQLLLDAGADKEAGDPKPIFYCMHESSQCLECMNNYGVDVNKSSKFRYEIKYPIHLALAANSPACVTALVGAGAWVTKKEMKGRHSYSPLQSALKMRPVPVRALRTLLTLAGERVLSEKIDRMPPLYWAVENSTLEGVHVLVEAGLDPTASFNDKYFDDVTLSRKVDHYDNVLNFVLSLLSSHDEVETSRLTANGIYLSTLPCFSEQK